MKSSDKELIIQVNRSIMQLMKEANLTVNEIASKLCMSDQQLRRKMHAIKGINAITYIAEFRTEYAKKLLRDRSSLTVAEIGRMCGFEEPGNFVRAFKQRTGVTPAHYRKGL